MSPSIFKAMLIPVVAVLFGFMIISEKGSGEGSKENYPEHLTGTFTGGFDEETCHSCHFDYDINWAEGSVKVSGLPDSVMAGKSYELIIRVMRENLGKAGFQLSARKENGKQAGRFLLDSSARMQFTKGVSDSLEYVQHSAEGTIPLADNENQWNISWEAPLGFRGKVLFNLAVNAANGDQSEFGDWIYVRELETRVIK